MMQMLVWSKSAHQWQLWPTHDPPILVKSPNSVTLKKQSHSLPRRRVFLTSRNHARRLHLVKHQPAQSDCRSMATRSCAILLARPEMENKTISGETGSRKEVIYHHNTELLLAVAHSGNHANFKKTNFCDQMWPLSAPVPLMSGKLRPVHTTKCTLAIPKNKSTEQPALHYSTKPHIPTSICVSMTVLSIYNGKDSRSKHPWLCVSLHWRFSSAWLRCFILTLAACFSPRIQSITTVLVWVVAALLLRGTPLCTSKTGPLNNPDPGSLQILYSPYLSVSFGLRIHGPRLNVELAIMAIATACTAYVRELVRTGHILSACYPCMKWHRLWWYGSALLCLKPFHFVRMGVLDSHVFTLGEQFSARIARTSILGATCALSTEEVTEEVLAAEHVAWVNMIGLTRLKPLTLSLQVESVHFSGGNGLLQCVPQGTSAHNRWQQASSPQLRSRTTCLCTIDLQSWLFRSVYIAWERVLLLALLQTLHHPKTLVLAHI